MTYCGWLAFSASVFHSGIVPPAWYAFRAARMAA
jgi:hypothetical protein